MIPIVTPLIHSDALTMAEDAIGEASALLLGSRFVLLRERIAKALMDVDTASREQAAENADTKERYGDDFIPGTPSARGNL